VHEFGLCEGVLDAVLTRAAGRPVSEIRVRCGIRHAVDPETMAQAFGFVAAGTEADGAAARKLWGLTARDLQDLQDHMLLLGRKTALERVACFLIRLSTRNLSSTALDLPMSRSDIADYLGLTIETVSRTFTQLERDGAISIPSSRHILLHDRLAMADL